MAARNAYLRRIRHWIVNRGTRGLLREIVYRCKLLLQGKPLPGRPNERTSPHPFDLAHHVDTTGLIWGEALGAQTDRDTGYWATGYYGVAPSAFDAALDRLALDWTRFTFVDIGCGKGRALLLGTRLPFRALLGVELSPELAVIARRNLETFRASWGWDRTQARVLAEDATTVELPGGPLLLFLYHPFAAPVMRRFLDHVLTAARAERREMYLLYTNPELAELLDAYPGFTRLWEQWTAMTAEESAADRFSSTQECTVAYRISVP